VVRFPVGAGNFSLHHRVQTGSGVHPASCRFPRGVKQPGREGDHSPSSSAEVKNVWPVPPPSTFSWRGAQLSTDAYSILAKDFNEFYGPSFLELRERERERELYFLCLITWNWNTYFVGKNHWRGNCMSATEPLRAFHLTLSLRCYGVTFLPGCTSRAWNAWDIGVVSAVAVQI
jgi:hypothetical protein